jgi:aminoglycoside phosphotransferase family enzyme
VFPSYAFSHHQMDISREYVEGLKHQGDRILSGKGHAYRARITDGLAIYGHGDAAKLADDLWLVFGQSQGAGGHCQGRH